MAEFDMTPEMTMEETKSFADEVQTQVAEVQ